jgi:CheY-like chemotaxis protein
LVRRVLLTREASFDVALVDINLNGEHSFPVAVVLRDRNIPFIFLIGYDKQMVPEAFAGAPLLRKPFLRNDLDTALRQLVGPGS